MFKSLCKNDQAVELNKLKHTTQKNGIIDIHETNMDEKYNS